MIIEPIPGEGGFIVPAPGFLTALGTWCGENGMLLIGDEIQSGLSRTGRWFASDWEGLEPDLVTTAKALAAGMGVRRVTTSNPAFETLDWSPWNGWAPTTSVDASCPRAV